jgi:opacity protein-like surface antigen
MRCNIARLTIAVLSSAVLLAIIAPAAPAATCSTARAAGTYGVSDSGTVVGIGPRATVSLLTLEVAGNIKAKVTASLNGSVTRSMLSGTYTVNPDCTGTASFSEFDQSGNLILTATADLVWDDNMREIRFIFTSVALADGTPLATVMSGNARKLVP